MPLRSPYSATCRLLITFGILFFAVLPGVGQTFDGNLTLTSQAQVDTFAYAHVTGSLHVRGPEVVSLEPLDQLERVDGFLELSQLGGLTSVNGFSNLKTVSGGLNIQRNANIVSISGFHALDSLGGLTIWSNGSLERIDAFSTLRGTTAGVTIELNDALERIEGFDALQTVGRTLRIAENAELTSIDGFMSLIDFAVGMEVVGNPELRSVDGFESLREPSGRLLLSTNPALTSIGGFSRLESVGGLRIFANSALVDLTSFGQLRTIQGPLTILYNIALASLDGFSALREVSSDLVIGGNHSLTDLGPLPAVALAGEIWIAENAIQSISGFDELTTLTNLRIEEPGLISIDGFAALEDITVGGVWIEGNAQLVSIAGFNSLRSVGGNIRLRSNPLLERIDAFPVLESLGMDLVLEQNARLASMPSFDLLRNVPGNLSIRQNDSLLSIQGFDRLTEIGGRLRLEVMANLQTLDAFSSLQSVGGDMDITAAPHLSSISDMPVFTTIGGGLRVAGTGLRSLNAIAGLSSAASVYIDGNPELTECNCALYKFVEEGHVPVTLINNGPGCNTSAAILQQGPCIFSSVDDDARLPHAIGIVGVYPNPFATTTTVRFGLPSGAEVVVEVFDAAGRRVARVLNEWRSSGWHDIDWDATGLPAGVYFLRIQSGAGIETAALIRM
jgi:hypothetical protein